MAYRRVRVFEGGHESEASHIVGFSAGASDAPDATEFRFFMASRGYTTTEIEPPEGSPSYRHIEVRPPMTEEHLQEFGSLCLQVVDGGDDGVVVYDNRNLANPKACSDAPVIAAN